MALRSSIQSEMDTLQSMMLTLDESVEALVQVISSPMHPAMCACIMFVASVPIQLALDKTTSVPAKVKLARSWPKLLRAGIKFLTEKRSRENFKALIENLTQNCRCNQGDLSEATVEERMAYLRMKPESSDPMNLRKAVHTIIDCIQLALYGQTQHKFRRGDPTSSSSTKPESLPWPQDPADLLPFGPVDSVDGIDLWAEGPGGYYTYRLATSLALYYAPFQQAMVRPPDFTFAIVRASKHLTGVMDSYSEDPARARANPELFQWPISIIFDFFQILINHDKFAAMMRVHGPTISPVLDRLRKVLAKLPAEEWIADTRVGIEVLSGFATGDLAEMQRRAGPLVDAIRDPVYDAFADMAMVRKGGCSNMTCPHARDTVHARLCGQCNLMRFCGEQCQKEAWKNPLLPHKNICVKIAALREQIGKRTWAELWTSSEDMTTARFESLPRKKLDKKNVEAIGKILTDMKAFKLAIRQDSPLGL